MRRLFGAAVIAALIGGCASSGSTVSPAAPTTAVVSSVATAAPTSSSTAAASTTTAAPITTTVARTTTTVARATGATTTTAAAAAPTMYAVGRHSVDLVDTSRPTPANGTFPGAPTRTLPTLILYPAAGDPAAPPAEGAPPAEAAYGFPLVIYAHGNNGSPELSLPMLTRLAAAGFLVAAPAFPLSKRDAPGGHTAADYHQQPGDMRFVLDEVLAGRVGPVPAVDGGRVAVVGHSLGAITVLGLTQNSCCHDDRIRAAVAISGTQGQWDGTWYQPPTTPLLLIHGDHDDVVPYSGSTDVFAAARSPVALVTLVGGPHTLYGPPWLDVVAATTIDFLRAELDDDASAKAALAVDGNQPGLATVQQR